MSSISSRFDPRFQKPEYTTVSTRDVAEPQSLQPDQYVKWGIHWKAPVKMIGLLLLGTAVALGHHNYYHYLDKKKVSTDSSRWNFKSQQWELRYGTAFAFLAKTCLAACISVAYQQQIWASMRKKSITISGIDATFGATKDLFAFFNTSFLFNVQIGAVLAALTWLMPLSALITPATLTVVPSVKTTPQVMNVPMVNYSDISALYSIDQSIQDFAINTLDNGVTPFLNRLMAGTASGHKILPIAAPFAASANYSLNFSAPSMQCVTASPNISALIQHVINGSASSFEIDLSSKIQFLAFTPQLDMLQSLNIPEDADVINYSAFFGSCILSSDNQTFSPDAFCDGMAYYIPVGEPETNGFSTDDCASSGSSSDDGSDSVCGGSTPRTSPVGPADVWVYVAASDDYWSCSVRDTQFDINFNVTGNVQTIDQEYNFEYTGQSLNNSHYVHGQIMSNWLTGILFGYKSGIISYRTLIPQTALFGSLKTNGQNTSTESDDSVGWVGDIADPAISAADKALARGLNMGQLIEELSRNLTLSYFSADILHLPGGVEAVVNIETTPNIYHYNVTNLAWAYGTAIAVTLLSAIVGMRAMLANGVSHETSFSSILRSTRNSTLDKLSVGSSLAASPLGNEVKETELRFGLLRERKNEHGLIKRVGFGVNEEVSDLRKGARCY